MGNTVALKAVDAGWLPEDVPLPDPIPVPRLDVAAPVTGESECSPDNTSRKAKYEIVNEKISFIFSRTNTKKIEVHASYLI